MHLKKMKTLLCSSFLLFGVTVHTASAQNDDKGTICHLKKILGPYPAKGSVEEAQDFATLFEYQQSRTPEQCAAAGKEVKVSLENFFGGKTGLLTESEVKRLKPFFLRYFIKAGINSTIGKFIFKRPRPYISNPDIVPCIPLASSYAYPSGHTTVARVLAYALAKKFPERAQDFMRRADEIARNRILGGVHHPSDIVAGKKLGDELTHRLFLSENFLKELIQI